MARPCSRTDGNLATKKQKEHPTPRDPKMAIKIKRHPEQLAGNPADFQLFWSNTTRRLRCDNYRLRHKDAEEIGKTSNTNMGSTCKRTPQPACFKSNTWTHRKRIAIFPTCCQSCPFLGVLIQRLFSFKVLKHTETAHHATVTWLRFWLCRRIGHGEKHDLRNSWDSLGALVRCAVEKENEPWPSYSQTSHQNGQTKT